MAKGNYFIIKYHKRLYGRCCLPCNHCSNWTLVKIKLDKNFDSNSMHHILYLECSRVALKRRRAEKNRLAAAEYSKVCVRDIYYAKYEGGGVWPLGKNKDLGG